jgi:hypothetical protein
MKRTSDDILKGYPPGAKLSVDGREQVITWTDENGIINESRRAMEGYVADERSASDNSLNIRDIIGKYYEDLTSPELQLLVNGWKREQGKWSDSQKDLTVDSANYWFQCLLNDNTLLFTYMNRYLSYTSFRLLPPYFEDDTHASRLLYDAIPIAGGISLWYMNRNDSSFSTYQKACLFMIFETPVSPSYYVTRVTAEIKHDTKEFIEDNKVEIFAGLGVFTTIAAGVLALMILREVKHQ